MSRRRLLSTSSLPVAAALVMLAASVVGCSDRKLVPVELDQPDVVDDLVDIEAEFCTRPVEDVTFPVKLLVVLDGSGSLQFTDIADLRLVAVRRLMASLATQNDVSVATMVFGSSIAVDPEPESGRLFVPASEWVEPTWLPRKELATSYQAGLAAVKAHLLKDLLQSDPAEIVRSKYIVIFFSDGNPEPLCCSPTDKSTTDVVPPFGCPAMPDQLTQVGTNYAGRSDPVTFCEGQAEPPVCNFSDGLASARDAVDTAGEADKSIVARPDIDGDGQPDGALPGLELGSNYNRTFQVEDLVTDIMDTGAEFGVGEIRLHTALLADDVGNLGGTLLLNRCVSERLLQRMAELGNGLYRDFNNGGSIDFLSFNFTSLRQGFQLVRAFAQDRNALPPLVQGNVAGAVETLAFRPDTDGDGVDDDAELAFGTDVAVPDSDKLAAPPAAAQVPEPIADPRAWGDGWSDGFEMARLSLGFDPRFQSLPIDLCDDPLEQEDNDERDDIDGDGLVNCEEDVLGTDRERADSDGDGLPDGLELRFGLDPARPEGNRDDDFDGLPNADEVVRGTDPQVADTDLHDRTGVRYELTNTGATDDGRTCYRSIARGVHLAATAPREDGGRSGYNDVLFFVAEASTEATSRVELRVACHRAQYLPPNFKDPANATIRFVEDDFLDLSDSDDLARFVDGEGCKGLEVR